MFAFACNKIDIIYKTDVIKMYLEKQKVYYTDITKK